METKFANPGQFIKTLLGEIKKTSITLVTNKEIKGQTAEQVAKKYQQPFQTAWQEIEKLSAAPLLEDIDASVTINRMDLYYAGILKTPEGHELNQPRLREIILARYAKFTGQNPATVESEKVMECPDTLSSDWQQPLISIEAKINFFFTKTKQPDYHREGNILSQVKPETTVKEIIDFIIARLEKALA